RAAAPAPRVARPRADGARPGAPLARRIRPWKLARTTPSGSGSLSEPNPAADRVEARLHPDLARSPRWILQAILWDPSIAGFGSFRRAARAFRYPPGRGAWFNVEPSATRGGRRAAARKRPGAAARKPYPPH